MKNMKKKALRDHVVKVRIESTNRARLFQFIDFFFFVRKRQFGKQTANKWFNDNFQKSYLQKTTFYFFFVKTLGKGNYGVACVRVVAHQINNLSNNFQEKLRNLIKYSQSE